MRSYGGEVGIADRYTWEAETASGDLITQGGDLAGCVRFSLRAAPGLHLPAHDIVGVPMVRRFRRVLQRVAFNNWKWLPGQLAWEQGSKVVATSESLVGIVQPRALIRKRYNDEKWWMVEAVCPEHITLLQPYTGKSKWIESKLYVQPPTSECLHCVVCEDFRLYVKSTDGTALVTPPEYELYL